MYLTFYHDIEKKSIGSERFDKNITKDLWGLIREWLIKFKICIKILYDQNEDRQKLKLIESFEKNNLL